jgi:hypothetical protein
MLEKRKNPRYRTLARAIIPGILEGDNFLKDISITGGCVECTTVVDLPPGSQVQLEVEPESAARIGNFQLVIERKWTRAGGYSNEIGFRIVESPKGRQFQRYVDYLAYRSAQT